MPLMALEDQSRRGVDYTGVHAAQQAIDGRRVFADQNGGELMDYCGETRAKESFPESGDLFIRLDLDDGPVEIRLEHGRAKMRDLHKLSR